MQKGIAIPKQPHPVCVVWEVELDRAPPSTFVFKKPKLWLIQKTRLAPGKFYTLLAPLPA